jgi:hypothetical protein
VQAIEPQQHRWMRERQQHDAAHQIDQQQDLHRAEFQQQLFLQKCVTGPYQRRDHHQSRAEQVIGFPAGRSELITEEQQHPAQHQCQPQPLCSAEALAEDPDAAQPHQQRCQLDQ